MFYIDYHQLLLNEVINHNLVQSQRQKVLFYSMDNNTLIKNNKLIYNMKPSNNMISRYVHFTQIKKKIFFNN